MKKRKAQILAIIIAISFLICACSDPRDTTLPSDVSKWKSDQELTKSAEKLPEDEKKMLAAYMMRTALSGAFGGEGVKEGITIGEAVETQKQWQEEQENEKKKQKILAEEIQKKQLESLQRMNDALTVTLLSIRFQESNPQSNQYSDLFVMSVGFKNNTNINMSGAKGVIVLKDMFGEIIKRVNLSNDDGIPANSSITWSGSMDYNQFMDSDKKLRSTEFEKIQFEWMPDMYLFDNGEKLTMVM